MGTLTLVSSLFEIQIGINGSVLSASQETMIIYNFVGNAALTVVLNIAARINKVKSIIAKTEMIIFLLMLLLNFVINECFFTARLSEIDQSALLVGTVCSFILMILTMILYERMTSVAQKQKQSELAAQTAQLISEHQDELKSIYKKMLAEQHDLRHRVAAAEEILSAGTFSEEQMQHIRGLLKERQEERTFLTGNMAVDAILKAKYAVMDNVGIAFEFVEYPLEPLPIPEQDFCMLLGNLLDNAIEGVMRLPASAPSRNIRLAFSKVWDMLFITCENDADISKIRRQGETFLSTKDQPVLHGFGTENMKQIVRKAGGTIEFETVHNQFTVQIMLGGSHVVDQNGSAVDWQLNSRLFG
ncbi:MAG: sensor histidine kinase [Oscillospiraceae bacterium]|nr:sensor histidine kinase [Oscillospiraceae bacterium]